MLKIKFLTFFAFKAFAIACCIINAKPVHHPNITYFIKKCKEELIKRAINKNKNTLLKCKVSLKIKYLGVCIMGWATLTLRKVSLKQQLNDNSLEQIQLSSIQRRLANFSSAISQGVISPSQIASIGTSLFGDAMTFMENAQDAAMSVATDQANYYTQTYENLTADQYASSGLASQAQLYFDPETGSLDYDSILQNFYEENLKEYAEEFAPILNEKQKEIETEMTNLQTEEESMRAELDQLDNSISSEIQGNTIKLS